MAKSCVVRFRCTPEQKKKIEDMARYDIKTVSEFLLNLVEEEEWKRIKSTDEMATAGGHTTTAPHRDQ